MDCRTYYVYGIYDVISKDSQDLLVVRHPKQLARQMEVLVSEGKISAEDLRVIHIGFYKVTDVDVVMEVNSVQDSSNIARFIAEHLEADDGTV